MNFQEITWLIPLVLLPGVALLLMSTSLRYGQIHQEIHYLHDESGHKVSGAFVEHLYRRARFFRNALVGLYLSVGAFALGSITGAILDLANGPSEWAVIAFACVGILSLIFAAVTLGREATLSLRVLEMHLDEIPIDKD